MILRLVPLFHRRRKQDLRLKPNTNRRVWGQGFDSAIRKEMYSLTENSGIDCEMCGASQSARAKQYY